MKAVTYQPDQDRFSVSDIAIPTIASKFDVLVRVHSVALNPVDAKVSLWHAMVPDMNDDFVGGLDVSGEIVAVGEAVDGWSLGDRVLYHGNMRRTHGGFAEYALQDSRTLIAHPNVPSSVAAATPCAAWTAYLALVDRLDIKNRKSIFIAGGAGGVGTFALQLAQYFGVETIITTASLTKHEYVTSMGATHAIDYRDQDVVSEVLKLTNGDGVEVSLDCVGGDNDIICADVLSYEGHMVELVKVVEPSKYSGAFLKGLSFHQLSLGSGHAYGERGRASIVSVGEAVSQLLEQGQLRVPELEVVSLDQISGKLMEIRQQRTTGKIVVNLAGRESAISLSQDLTDNK